MTRIHIFNNIYIKKMETKDILTAKLLCDRHVGKGLYSEEFFHDILLLENHFFYIVYDKDKVIGFFYYLVITPGNPIDIPGLDILAFREVPDKNGVLGICRSIGIEESYRGNKLSDVLLQYFTSVLFESYHVQVIFIPAWVKGSYIPARRLLEDNNYSFLCNLYKPWINNTQLQCPYCKKKRCICDAVIYHMKESTYYEKKALSS